MIIQLLLAFKIVQQILFDLYLWQLKEYRTDRFFEHLERKHQSFSKSLLKLTIFSPFSTKSLPKPTLKALVVFTLSCLINLLFFIPGSLILAAASSLLTPFIVYLAILCIQPAEIVLRHTFYDLASRKIRSAKKKHGLVVIGIVGSYGKTTTKNFLSRILSLKHNVISTKASVNTPLAISLLILRQLRPAHTHFVVEMGAYKKGEIKQLCYISKPSIGIITGISNQHLALFGNQKQLIVAKSEIAQEIDQKGWLLINKDSLIRPILPKKNSYKIIYYNKNSIPSQLQKIVSKNIPDHLISCMAPALIIARQFKISDEQIIKNSDVLKSSNQRSQLHTGPKGCMIIDDSYSCNLQGISGLIKTLKKYKRKKKIIIFSPIVELGDEAEKTHHRIGSLFAFLKPTLISVSSEYFSSLKKGFLKGGKILLIEDAEKIVAFLEKEIDKNTIIVLEGRISPKIINFLKQNNRV